MNEYRGIICMICALACALFMLPVQAQDTLAAQLRRLPASIGANRSATMPSGSWVDFGIQERVGFQHLKLANPRGFSPGQTVLVPARHQVSALTTNGLVLNLPELRLYRWVNGRVADSYPVSIGRITSRWHTPVGTLAIINKVSNPAWHRPSWAGGGVVPPGPRNPLGDRWIGLDRPGYGIHGTNDPTSIGRMVSHGCIRLFPPHIHELFAAVRVGMPVIITYETVTIGEDNGVVYASVFPDIYARGTNQPAHVRAELARFGLEGIFTASELERLVARADGVSQPILGSTMTIRVNGTPLASPVGPTLREGVSYVPLRAIGDALGATVQWDGARNEATLELVDRSVSFTTRERTESGEAGGFIGLGTFFVPVRALAEGLGATVDFADGVINIRS